MQPTRRVGWVICGKEGRVFSGKGPDAGTESVEGLAVARGVEAVAVDGGGVFGEAEEAGLGVAGLWRRGRGQYKLRYGMSALGSYLRFWSDASDFYVAESEVEETCISCMER